MKTSALLKKTGGLLVALLIGLGTLYGLFALYNKREVKRVVHQQKKIYEFIETGRPEVFPRWDEIGEFPPLSVMRYHGIYEDGRPAFDVKYKLRADGLRLEESSPGKKKSHFIVGGCSFIFGIGINVEDTLTSQLRSKGPGVNFLNLGHGGGGLHTQLRTFDLIDIKSLAPEAEGTYIYFAFFDHLYRWKGAPSYLAWAQPDDIHYMFKGKKLVHMKISESDAYKEFMKARQAGLDMVFIKSTAISEDQWADKDIEEFTEGVRLLKIKYNKLYPKGRFLFGFYPYFYEHRIAERLKKKLEKKGVEYYYPVTEFFDYMKKNHLTDADMTVPVEGHPNRKFNDYFSDVLIQRFGLK